MLTSFWGKEKPPGNLIREAEKVVFWGRLDYLVSMLGNHDRWALSPFRALFDMKWGLHVTPEMEERLRARGAIGLMKGVAALLLLVLMGCVKIGYWLMMLVGVFILADFAYRVFVFF